MPRARTARTSAARPTAKETSAALTGEPTARESMALVGAWSATKAPLTKAPTTANRMAGCMAARVSACPGGDKLERSALELAGQQADVGVELRILGAELLDLADGVDDRGVVAPAEAAADL